MKLGYDTETTAMLLPQAMIDAGFMLARATEENCPVCIGYEYEPEYLLLGPDASTGPGFKDGFLTIASSCGAYPGVSYYDVVLIEKIGEFPCNTLEWEHEVWTWRYEPRF